MKLKLLDRVGTDNDYIIFCRGCRSGAPAKGASIDLDSVEKARKPNLLPSKDLYCADCTMALNGALSSL